MTMSHSHLSCLKYRPDIDGLRAVAVLSVVMFHAFPNWLKGGFVGVDVFFVISGYLISIIIFDGFNKGAFSFSDFYARRIKRIFPALLIVLASSFAFGWFVLLSDEYKQLGKHVAAGAGFVSNFVLWGEAGYFDNSAETKPLLHLWSLGVEEQFYLAWPVLLWFARKQVLNTFLMVLFFVVISFAVNIKMVGHEAVAAFYSPQTRFWELLSGSLLAWLVVYKSDISAGVKTRLDAWAGAVICMQVFRVNVRVLPSVLSFIGLSALVYGFFNIDEELNFPGKWALVPVVGAVLLISAGPDAWVNRVVLSNKVAVWFGLISFPLYLWHWPLLSFVHIVEGEVPGEKVRIAVVFISIGLAWLTYKFVERPVRLGEHAKLKVAVVVVFMSIVGCVGYGAYSLEGLGFRGVVKADEVNAKAFEWSERNIHSSECVGLVKPLQSKFCMVSKNFIPSIALIGDSHANALFDYFDGYFQARGAGVILLGKGGCPPFVGVERDDNQCPKLWDDITDYVVSNKDITDVYIAGRFAATLSGVNFGVVTRSDFYSLRLLSNPAVTERDKIFKIGLASTLKKLIDSGKNVTIVLDSPELNFDPRSCVKKRLLSKCQIDRAIVVERQSSYRRIVRELASSYKFKVVDLMGAFCKEASCIAQYKGEVLYRDTHHLGVLASKFLLASDFSLEGDGL